MAVTHKISIRSLILHCICPLMFGGILYLLFRQQNLLSHWLQSITGTGVLQIESWPAQRILDVLPDFLWAYSLSISMFLYGSWSGLPARTISWLTGSFLVLSEGIQALPNSSFTFDYWDLACMAVAYALACIYTTKIHLYARSRKPAS